MFDIWQKLTLIFLCLSGVLIIFAPTAGGVAFLVTVFLGFVINNRGTM